jgi:SEC-C motif
MRLAEQISEADLAAALTEADDAGTPDPTIERIQAAIADPTLRGDNFTPTHATVVISELQRHFGRDTDAEATLRAAVAADLHDPDDVDPAAWLAALLVDTNRAPEAAEVFAGLKATGRIDAFDHEVYAEALEAAGDLPAALKIYAAGQLLAEQSGHRAQQARLAQAAHRVRTGDDRNPNYAVPALSTAFGRLHTLHHRATRVMFWPHPDHTRALAQYPTLADPLGPTWDAHRTTIEQTLARLAETDHPPTLTRAHVDDFTTHLGPDTPASTTLTTYAEAPHPTTATIPWPPDRNAPCWCGSTQKYKRCCRPRAFTRD